MYKRRCAELTASGTQVSRLPVAPPPLMLARPAVLAFRARPPGRATNYFRAAAGDICLIQLGLAGGRGGGGGSMLERTCKGVVVKN